MFHQDLNPVVKHILFFNIFHVDYVDDIFKTMYEALQSNTLKDAITELKQQTPAPMHTMLVKQSWEEAIQKKTMRDSMQLVDVPPTNPGTHNKTVY